MLFPDRRAAGRILARALGHYRNRPDSMVLALPRGGVPVGYEVARALEAPLDVFLVRKLGLPGNEEFAMGAIASGGVRLVDKELIRQYRIPENALNGVVDREERELRRREHLYRRGLPPVEVRFRTVLLVDDGLATGASMRAAVEAVRALGARRIIAAVPVGPRETVRELSALADEVVCPSTPEPFRAVGQFYESFEQTTDEEVIRLLEQAHAERSRRAVGAVP